MSTQKLMAEFDRLAEAPGATPQLREFIRALAVRGRLSEHDATDTSARKLRANILAERARLTEEGELRKRDTLPEPTVDEIPFDVPPNWCVVRLGEAVDLVNGRAFKPSEWSKTGTPIIRIQNLNDESAPFNYCNFEVQEKVRIRNGDFLISWSGTPGTSFGAHIWTRGDGVLNQHIFKARLLGDAFEPAFLRLAINSRLLELISQAQGGVGLQHITKPKLEALVLTLPPLAEQRRIVAKVDELMVLLDRLEATQAERERRRDRLAAAAALGTGSGSCAGEPVARFLDSLTVEGRHITLLRRRVIDIALTGGFPTQASTDEDAAALLRRVSRTQTGAHDTAPEFGEAGPHEGWRIVPLIALGRWAIGSGFPKEAQGDDRSEFFFVKVSDMNLPGNEVRIATCQNTISAKAAAELRARLHPAGTIVFPKIGGAIATNKRRILTRPSAIDNNCLGITFSPEVSLEWAFLLLSSLDFSQYQAGTAVPALQQAVIGQIPVLLPPRQEQERIVEMAKHVMSLIDALASETEAIGKKRAAFLEATLAALLTSES